MISAGITGGIGSGKSYVSAIFQHLGIPVFNADLAGRDILHNDKNVQEQIRNTFGNAVFSEQEVDRKALAQIVFNDAKMLEKLNAIIHPAVASSFENWRKAQQSPYIIKEAAILFETGNAATLDFVMLVTAPVSERIARVVARDKSKPEEIEKRMQAQWPDSKKAALADAVIDNADGVMLLPQVLALHEHLLSARR